MHAQRLLIPSGAERIETLVEAPEGVPRGLALIAHPHPLRGGNLDNKVVWSLAKAALARGLVAVRPNFRGVGASTGEHDHGSAETEDLLAVAAALDALHPGLPWTLMGFSFGCYVLQRVGRVLPARQAIFVGAAVSMYDFGAPALPTTLIHGADDEVIPLVAAQAYAEAHGVPLQVMADCGHFFHGRLGELRARVEALCPTP